jgi:hypothetical protein
LKLVGGKLLNCRKKKFGLGFVLIGMEVGKWDGMNYFMGEVNEDCYKIVIKNYFMQQGLLNHRDAKHHWQFSNSSSL